MGKVIKRPIVIKDLIELATYIADGNIDISDNFLFAAETTFVNQNCFLENLMPLYLLIEK